MPRPHLTQRERRHHFAVLAQALRERGHGAQAVPHFVNRLVFCTFAEDVGLLPDRMFTRMLRGARQSPDDDRPNPLASDPRHNARDADPEEQGGHGPGAWRGLRGFVRIQSPRITRQPPSSAPPSFTPALSALERPQSKPVAGAEVLVSSFCPTSR